jgi:MinD superfamily P-loop ATPase
LKEIVVISGKGGTGKTSIAASFALLGGRDVVIADCDVDASDMHLLTKPDIFFTENFYSGKTAVIDAEKCSLCDLCRKVCRFDAIKINDGIYSVRVMDCEGCGYCDQVCPADAVILKDKETGKFFKSHTRMGNTLIHASLNIGADNSGKLVSKIRKESKAEAQQTKAGFIVIDGSPGTGCPVIASLTGADYAVLVTETTRSGYHDLRRVYELVEQFHLSAGCIINKADINAEIRQEIKHFLHRKGIALLAEIPYDERFSAAITQGISILEYDHGELSKILESSWETIKATWIS